MTSWGAQTFGDPCQECGYSWSTSLDAAVTLVEGVPTRYRELTTGANGRERHPDLGWDITSYVAHVSDNLRIAAERMMGAVLSGDTSVVGYDQDALAVARRYDRLRLPAVLWSLERSVPIWTEAVAAGRAAGLVMQHDVRGAQSVQEMAVGNAHDAHHHGWDLSRILDAN